LKCCIVEYTIICKIHKKPGDYSDLSNSDWIPTNHRPPKANSSIQPQ
jgi:hypothetical protein